MYNDGLTVYEWLPYKSCFLFGSNFLAVEHDPTFIEILKHILKQTFFI